MAIEFPEIIEIELTSRCNKKCIMCQRQWMDFTNVREDLSMGLLEKVLEDVDDRDVQINLGGLGEGLLVKELPQFFAAIKKHNRKIKTGFNTNGKLLTEAEYNWILDGRVDYLSVSLDAPAEKEYEWLIQDNDFNLVYENCEKFLMQKQRSGSNLHVTVHCFNIPRFQKYIPGFIDRWKDKCDFVQVRDLVNWAGVVPVSEFGVEENCSGICKRPFISLAIDTEGNYHKCCGTFYLEDDCEKIRNKSIEDFWNGEEMEKFRTAMLNNDFPDSSPCAKCSARSVLPNTVIEQGRH
ncbi:MAG: radical SAM protein [Bacillota bacterium]|nr:radical SAM protein [Bacillota bacterium]